MPWNSSVLQRSVTAALRSLLDNRTWRRHPAPFAKTERGRLRREVRRFVRSFDTARLAQ